ncbi:hypothetical protein N7523_005716 [Penicillium sp. IBT 18751x]|nr:hypothetical protein N7523_005716 [Penicillium sp. IBT 18751x]
MACCPRTFLPTAKWGNLNKYSLFLPFLWPSDSVSLQIRMVICMLLAVIQRFINAMVPVQLSNIMNTPSRDEEVGSSASRNGVLVYVVFQSLQGGRGLLNSLRSRIWNPVRQHSYRQLSIAVFEHGLDPSLDFHIHDKKNELLPALKDTEWITTPTLNHILFQFGPMVIDIVIALACFSVQFDAYFAFVAGILTAGYVKVTLRLADSRTKIRSQFVTATQRRNALENRLETSYFAIKYFKYFNADEDEKRAFDRGIDDYLEAEHQY